MPPQDIFRADAAPIGPSGRETATPNSLRRATSFAAAPDIDARRGVRARRQPMMPPSTAAAGAFSTVPISTAVSGEIALQST
jgi:hypothetical protein